MELGRHTLDIGVRVDASEASWSVVQRGSIYNLDRRVQFGDKLGIYATVLVKGMAKAATNKHA